MNVKIADNAVTFKISEDELNRLQGGTALETVLSVGDKAFCAAIELSAGGDFSLDMASGDKARLTLRVSADKVANLAAMGKSREGLAAVIDGLDVALLVDVRADSRPHRRERG